MTSQCSFIKINGEKCKAYAIENSDKCFFHSDKVHLERTPTLDMAQAIVSRKPGPSFEKMFGKYLKDMPQVDKLKEYEKLYIEGGIVSRAIDSYVHVAVSNGYQIIDSKTGKRFTEGAKIIEELDERINFHESFEKIFRSCLIYGFAWGEIDHSDNKINRLLFLPPTEIEMERDEHGILKKMIQKKGGKAVTEWSGKKLDDVFYFPINIMHSEALGNGIMEKIYNEAKERNEEGKNLTAVTKFVAYPFRVVKVGSDTYPASKEAVDNVAEQIDDLDPGDWFTTRHTIDFQFFSPEAPEALVSHYKEKTRQLIVSLGVPSLYTVLEDIDANTLKEIRSIFNSTIRSLQKSITIQFEDQIIKRQFELLGKIKKRTDKPPAKIVWNPLTVSVLSILELTQLVMAGVVGVGEARRILESMGYGLLRDEDLENAEPISAFGPVQAPKESHPTEEEPGKPPVKPPQGDTEQPKTRQPANQPVIQRPQPNAPIMSYEDWLKGVESMAKINKYEAWLILRNALTQGYEEKETKPIEIQAEKQEDKKEEPSQKIELKIKVETEPLKIESEPQKIELSVNTKPQEFILKQEEKKTDEKEAEKKLFEEKLKTEEAKREAIDEIKKKVRGRKKKDEQAE